LIFSSHGAQYSARHFVSIGQAGDAGRILCFDKQFFQRSMIPQDVLSPVWVTCHFMEIQ